MIGQFDLLTQKESLQVHDKIIALKKYWVNRASDIEPFYTLGAASYLDAPTNDDSEYLAKAAKINPILKKNFKFLYDRLLVLLSEKLKKPVSYEKELGLPGFHIFQYSKTFEQPVGSIHFDLQFKSHNWNKYKEVDFDNPVSFTCAISLPHAGGGLNYWDLHHDEVDPDEIEIYAALKKMNYLPYSVGKIVVHHGMILHQIAPAKDISPEDERITLQGHGIPADGEIRLYW